MLQALTGKPRPTENPSQVERRRGPPTARMASWAGSVGSGFYRFEPERRQAAGSLDLRDEIQRIALEFPCYGPPPQSTCLAESG